MEAETYNITNKGHERMQGDPGAIGADVTGMMLV